MPYIFYIYTVSNLKELLYRQCLDYVQKRMDAAQQGIDEAQQASKEDTKSSAGDKYETGRAMMQQETDRNMAQLNEANKLKVALNAITTNLSSKQVERQCCNYQQRQFLPGYQRRRFGC